MISESAVSRLSIGLNLFDSAVECLNGLVWVPVFIKAFGVGLEVDGCDVTVFVKEVLDEDMDGGLLSRFFRWPQKVVSLGRVGRCCTLSIHGLSLCVVGVMCWWLHQ